MDWRRILPTSLLTEQDLNTKEALVLITLHRGGRNKNGNHDDPWSAQTSTQSDHHVTKRLSKRDASRYGAPFVSKLFVNVMFNVVPTYPVKCSCDRMNQPSLFFTLISLYGSWCDIFFLDIMLLPWCMQHFLPWYHFTAVMWHFLPWYHFTTVMQHFLPWYLFTAVMNQTFSAWRSILYTLFLYDLDQN